MLEIMLREMQQHRSRPHARADLLHAHTSIPEHALVEARVPRVHLDEDVGHARDCVQGLQQTREGIVRVESGIDRQLCDFAQQRPFG